MPCLGPTEQEMRAMEIAENKRRYGVAGTDLDIATKVACHLANGDHNKLTKAWITEHKKQDAARQRSVKEHEARILAQEEVAEVAKAIFKKHGLSYRE